MTHWDLYTEEGTHLGRLRDKVEHSPLPWRVIDFEIYAGGEQVADLTHSTVSDDDVVEANGEFIVRAVNQSPLFESAVKILDRCADKLQSIRNSDLSMTAAQAYQLKALERECRSVLAKIKETA